MVYGIKEFTVYLGKTSTSKYLKSKLDIDKWLHRSRNTLLQEPRVGVSVSTRYGWTKCYKENAVLWIWMGG